MFLTKDKLERQSTVYLPVDFNVTDWAMVDAYIDEILQLPIDNPSDLISLLYRLGELTSLVMEYYNTRYLQTLANTNDVISREETGFLLQNIIMPMNKRIGEVLRLYYNHPFRLQLNQDNYQRLNKLIAAHLKEADHASVSSVLQINELTQSYNQLCNSISLDYNGNAFPIKAVRDLLPKIDPAGREQLWKARKAALTANKESLADLMDRLIKARQAEAEQSGYKNYIEYALSTGLYADVDIHKLSAIHTTIRKAILPAVRDIVRQYKRSHKLKSIRPWDIESLQETGSLRPFTTSEELVEKAIYILYDIRFEYGILLNKMLNSGFLDLDYSPDKVQGEYYTALASYGAGRILMNCSGKHSDMTMLFHEMGHVLQTVHLSQELLGELTVLPVQSRELASQSMVYLSTVYWDAFYPDKQHRQTALRSLVEQDITQLLYWSMLNILEIALYTNPEWTPEQRESAMLDICHQYDWGIDWSGLEDWQKVSWMLENTLYGMPLYSFFSAFSILNVWQIYRNFRHNPVDTMTKFQWFIEHGAEITTADLINKLEIKEDYSVSFVNKLLDFMHDEIRKAGK